MKNILIIDDDKNFIKKIEEILSPIGNVTKGYSQEDFYNLRPLHKCKSFQI